jgi:hypothetical protein
MKICEKAASHLVGQVSNLPEAPVWQVGNLLHERRGDGGACQNTASTFTLGVGCRPYTAGQLRGRGAGISESTKV